MTPPSVESVPVPAAPCIPPAERKKGFCIRCGQPVPKRRRLYCSPECDHEFGVNHFWGMAAAEAWRRAGKVCQECGVGDTGHLVAHHIKPLAGGDRWATCENHQDNLVMLCASCHQKRHAEMRGPNKAKLRKQERKRKKEVARLKAKELQGVLL